MDKVSPDGNDAASLRAHTSVLGTTVVLLVVVCAWMCHFQSQLAASPALFCVPLALPSKKSAAKCEKHCHLLTTCFLVGTTLPYASEEKHPNSFSSRGMSPVRGPGTCSLL